jgi:hypothetical protein
VKLPPLTALHHLKPALKRNETKRTIIKKRRKLLLRRRETRRCVAPFRKRCRRQLMMIRSGEPARPEPPAGTASAIGQASSLRPRAGSARLLCFRLAFEVFPPRGCPGLAGRVPAVPFALWLSPLLPFSPARRESGGRGGGALGQVAGQVPALTPDLLFGP